MKNEPIIKHFWHQISHKGALVLVVTVSSGTQPGRGLQGPTGVSVALMCLMHGCCGSTSHLPGGPGSPQLTSLSACCIALPIAVLNPNSLVKNHLCLEKEILIKLWRGMKTWLCFCFCKKIKWTNLFPVSPAVQYWLLFWSQFIHYFNTSLWSVCANQPEVLMGSRPTDTYWKLASFGNTQAIFQSSDFLHLLVGNWRQNMAWCVSPMLTNASLLQLMWKITVLFTEIIDHFITNFGKCDCCGDSSIRFFSPCYFERVV